ncbi:hypothetical protein RRG08_015284 [Elysia crispata]|uniref:Ankyrin repeat protein n=1 Tax=Elysia crispata TaxID=231223 RepID=A0AAE0ZVM0_9GAST|nr:hypothetical protein RRG08_015284 [Elysia crispata]
MRDNELYLALSHHDKDRVERLLSLRSSKCLVDGDGTSTVHALIVDFLKQRHCRGDTGDDARRCALLEVLVQHGADVNIQSRSFLSYRKTAAMVAAEQGFLKCLQFLVESGANLEITGEKGESALTLAVKRGSAECVKYLIEKMPTWMLNHKDAYGRNALMLAALKRDVRKLEHLVESSHFDLNAQDGEENTALMLALQDKSTESVAFLLEKGALLNTVTRDGHTPLTIARSDKDILKLLHHGLDPTLCRRNRYYLHYVVLERTEAAVRALVISGFPPLDANCNKFMTFGSPLSRAGLPWKPISPLAVALHAKRPALAKYLITNRFFTRYDVAHLCNDQKIRQTLQEAADNVNSPNRHQARQSLEIFDFLSSTPQTLFNLCLVAIISALTFDFNRNKLHSVRGNGWICSPTFKQRVGRLEIPFLLKEELLHQRPASAICCLSWDEINLRRRMYFPECHCQQCCGTIDQKQAAAV